MRYTRYNYKKKKNNNAFKAILSFIGMSAFVVIVGVLLANIIIHFLPPLNNETNPKEQVSSNEVLKSGDNYISESDESANVNAEITNNEQDNSTNKTGINTDFIVIQCGYYAQESNAKKTFDKIDDEYGAFIYNESDKFKVLAGIYTLEEEQEVINRITAKGVECAKVSFKFNSGDLVQNQISGIYNGYLEILSTVFKDDVKLIDTTDFKRWVSELEEVNEGNNVEVLLDLKKHIKELNVEVKKEDVSNEMQYLYKVLLNFNK